VHKRPDRGKKTASVWLAGGGVAIALVVGFAWLFTGSGDASSPPAANDSGPDTLQPPLLVAGVEVARPWVDYGRIPLDTGFDHVYTLRNTGGQTVTLGEASIRVLEGC
jgi:hypothetical protein